MRPLLLILFALLLAACADPETDRRLARAEALMMTAPDSAAAVLDSIDPTPLRGRRAALHALLRTHANYRNYITDTDDSLINIAVDYFTSHPDPGRLMVARYCQGRILDNAGRYSEAMTAALTALDLATALNDPFYQARAHELMGDLWCVNSSYNNYITHASLASHYYNLTGKTDNARWAMLDVATGYSNIGQDERALCILDSLSRQNINDRAFCRNIQKLQIPLFNARHDFKKSMELIDSIKLSEIAAPVEQARLFAQISQTYAQAGRIDDAIMARDSARYYSSKIKEKDYFTENVIAFSECLIFGAQKQTDSLILTTNRIFQLQDSIITSANRENISNSVSDYLLADNHSLTSRKNRAVGILYITVILFILLCIFGIISYRKRLRAKNAAIASKMKELAKLASKYDELECSTKTDLSRQANIISGLISQKPQCRPVSSDMYIRLSVLKQLGSVFTMFSDDQKKAKNKLWAAVKSIIETTQSPNYINGLTKALDSDTKGLLSTFMPIIKGRSKSTAEIFVYTVAGLTPKEISAILDIPVSTVYSVKSSIKERVNESDDPRRMEMLLYFGNETSRNDSDQPITGPCRKS